MDEKFKFMVSKFAVFNSLYFTSVYNAHDVRLSKKNSVNFVSLTRQQLTKMLHNS